MAEHGIWGLGINQYLGHLIYALNLLVLKAAGWNLESFFLHDYGVSAGSLTASVGDWLRFMEHPQINSFLFWLKLPHLLVDIGVFVALSKLFTDHKHRLAILVSWWLNPVNLYAFYIFSRHDVFTAAALLAIVVFVARNRVVPAVLSLFAAIQIRVQPLLLAPLFLVQLWQQRKNYPTLLKQLVISGVVIGIYLVLLRALPNTGPVLEALRDAPRSAAAPASIGIPISHAQQVMGTQVFGIPIFLSLYALIGFWWLWQKKLAKAAFKTCFQSLVQICTATMALYFAINPFSPHYFVWLSIFFTLSVSISKKTFYWYGAAVGGWFMLGIFSSDVTWFSQNLFAPISTAVFRTPQLNQFLLPKLAEVGLQQPLLLGFGRAVLAVGALGIIWQLYTVQLQQLGQRIKQFAIPLVVLLFSLAYLIQPKSVQAVATIAAEQPVYSQTYDITQQPYQQHFSAPVNQFGTIEVRMGTDRSKIPGDFTFKLYTVLETGELDSLYEATYDRTQLYQGYYYPFGFMPVDTAHLGTEFIFELSSESQAPIYVYTDAEGKLSYTVVTDTTDGTFIDQLATTVATKIENQRLFFMGYSLLIAALTIVVGVGLFTSLLKYSK